VRRIVIGSGNRHKVEEIRRILSGLPVEWSDRIGRTDVPEPEETGTTFEENARLKAAAYARATGEWVLADDSGLEVDALAGRPGVLSARYAGPEQDAGRNIGRLLGELDRVPDDRRAARFVCVAVVHDGIRVLAEARGTCEGTIVRAPRGSGGFGYDPVFLVPDLGRTFAELSAAEKDRRSHRARALTDLRAALVRFLV